MFNFIKKTFSGLKKQEIILLIHFQNFMGKGI